MQDRRAPLDVFVGRAAELAQVSEVVSRVAAGQPWLVTIEGDPGVGKTALARRCLTGVSGLRVLPARAGQAETDLDFGLVDQLLRAAGGAGRPELPANDEAESAASSFAVGAHLLEVLGEQQARAAVVVLLVDDLQWADRRSVEALTFMLAAGPPEALAELGHLDADPGRVGLIDVDGLSFRGRSACRPGTWAGRWTI